MFGAQVFRVLRWLFRWLCWFVGCFDCAVKQSVLAMPGVCCFLRVTSMQRCRQYWGGSRQCVQVDTLVHKSNLTVTDVSQQAAATVSKTSTLLGKWWSVMMQSTERHPWNDSHSCIAMTLPTALSHILYPLFILSCIAPAGSCWMTSLQRLFLSQVYEERHVQISCRMLKRSLKW